MLCEKCHQQEAVVHLTESRSGGGTSQNTNLCTDCARSFPALGETVDLNALLRGGLCRFCRSEAHIPSTDPIAAASGVREMSFMCQTCFEEYSQFLLEKWPGFGDPAITAEQIAFIHNTDKAAVFRTAEEHMEQWVARRRCK